MCLINDAGIQTTGTFINIITLFLLIPPFIPSFAETFLPQPFFCFAYLLLVLCSVLVSV